MTEPKPCPFCGSRPAVEAVQREGCRIPAFAVRCTNGYCEIHPALGPFFNTRERTIAIWNIRRRKTK